MTRRLLTACSVLSSAAYEPNMNRISGCVIQLHVGQAIDTVVLLVCLGWNRNQQVPDVFSR